MCRQPPWTQSLIGRTIYRTQCFGLTLPPHIAIPRARFSHISRHLIVTHPGQWMVCFVDVAADFLSEQ